MTNGARQRRHAIATPHSLLVGFGLEGVSIEPERNSMMERILDHVLAVMADRLPTTAYSDRPSGRFAVGGSLTARGLNSSSTRWLSIGRRGSRVEAPGAEAGHGSQRAGDLVHGADVKGPPSSMAGRLRGRADFAFWNHVRIRGREMRRRRSSARSHRNAHVTVGGRAYIPLTSESMFWGNDREVGNERGAIGRECR